MLAGNNNQFYYLQLFTLRHFLLHHHILTIFQLNPLSLTQLFGSNCNKMLEHKNNYEKHCVMMVTINYQLISLEIHNCNCGNCSQPALDWYKQGTIKQGMA